MLFLVSQDNKKDKSILLICKIQCLDIRMVELVDTLGLGSSFFKSKGSSPFSDRTVTLSKKKI